MIDGSVGEVIAVYGLLVVVFIIRNVYSQIAGKPKRDRIENAVVCASAAIILIPGLMLATRLDSGMVLLVAVVAIGVTWGASRLFMVKVYGRDDDRI